MKHRAVCVSVCLWMATINFPMSQPIFIKVCMYIMATKSISMA
jgi:hypothetical protein